MAAREVVIRYPRAQARSIAGMAFGLIGFPLAMVLLGKALGREPPTWVMFAALATAVACGAAWATHRARKGRLEIDAETLTIAHGASERRRISKTEIESGLLVGEPERLDLTLASGEVLQISFSDSQAAQETLDALGIAEAQRRTRLRLYSPGAYVVVLSFGGIFGAIPGAVLGALLGAIVSGRGSGLTGFGYATVAATTLLISWLTARLATKILAHLTIGEDGIAWRVGGGRTRFATFEQVTGISLTRIGAASRPSWSLEIHVAGQKSHPIAYFNQSQFDEARAIVTRLEQAIAARALSTTAAGLAELEPGERPVGEWLVALRELGTRAGDYRSGLSRERLLDLVDDPAASAPHRIAAAVVLSSDTDETTRRRIRVAAESSANPKLSAALDAIGSAEIEEAAAVESVIDDALEQSRT